MSESPTPPEFTVAVEQADDHDVIRVGGELDMATVPELKEASGPSLDRGRPVFFDLSDLTFVDSSGLRFFVDLYQAAQRDELVFTMSRPRYRVFRAFEVTTLDTLLPWADETATHDAPARSRDRDHQA